MSRVVDAPSEHRRATGLSLAPFRALRYRPELAGAAVAPPYDAAGQPEPGGPYGIRRLIGAEPDTRLFHRWRREGVLVADPVPALYVYEQRGPGVLQRGLIGSLGVDGPVLPHEDVIPRRVADRIGLVRATRANLEPLLLSYQGDGGAAAVIERAARREPLSGVTTADGIRHSLWAVTGSGELGEIERDLSGGRALIADGHHRWEMYRQLQREHPSGSPWSRGLALLVDTGRHPLQVRAIHRVLPRLPLDRALAALGEQWRVKEVPGPAGEALRALAEAKRHGGNAFVLTGGDGTYRLVCEPEPALIERTVPGGRPGEWRRLDATVLHATLLGHTWRVPDEPAGIDYPHTAEAAELRAARTGGTAVLLHPVEERVVRRLAEQSVTMPHKSTSFGPKPAAGLVLRDLDLEQRPA